MPTLRESPSTAVARTLDVLEAIAQRPPGLTNAEISRRLQIPKSSASYLLRTLVQRGYLRREADTGRYRLGLKLLGLSRGALAGLDVREVALPLMRQLVEHCGLTAHLAILDRGEAVYIEKVDAPGFIKMDTWVGKRMELHSTSVGKTLTAGLDDTEVHEILRERGLRKLTPRTITQHGRFLKELEKVRAQGYAEDDEENSLGVHCVAAPIFNAAGQVEASLGVTGTTQQVTPAAVPRIAEMVKETARRISHQLGFLPARAGRTSG